MIIYQYPYLKTPVYVIPTLDSMPKAIRSSCLIGYASNDLGYPFLSHIGMYKYIKPIFIISVEPV